MSPVLQRKNAGGRGILLGGVPGVSPAHLVILGGGTVGMQAARIALGMGARVSILDINLERLRQLDLALPGRFSTLYSNQANISDAIASADAVIGSVLIRGARAPHLITRPMLADMPRGSLIVDVAVDQGRLRGDDPAPPRTSSPLSSSMASCITA